MLAARSSYRFGLYFRRVDINPSFGFHHEDRQNPFGHEVGDVFRLFAAQLVVNLKLQAG